MMPTGSRTHRYALLIGQVLVLVLLALSSRAVLSPKASYTKAKDSKRPKVPKNVVRAEPLRITAEAKQVSDSDPKHPTTWFAGLDGIPSTSLIHELPRKAYTQLTQPDYLNPSGSPPLPFAPPS